MLSESDRTLESKILVTEINLINAANWFNDEQSINGDDNLLHISSEIPHSTCTIMKVA